ncbi:DUF3179 domain-containing protein [Halorarius litoreus]|uniref:DUF3179 domain-containing protein n=1 Tax=Halorarius litoreus TaxID=2962676 RepID=UPI0020CC0FB7|nr:DUF3179 domain-containing protein [Halorarius litoreus]
MDRRRYLGGAGALGIGAIAGCTGLTGSQGSGVDTGDGGKSRPPTADGEGLPVPESELRRGAPKDAIPAITDPEFAADWRDQEWSLSDGDQVVGVARGGEARAYPLSVLNWHEIVNDELDGPLLVTYCPLCGSAVTAVREVNGQETTFGVSGFLYMNDLVMYDRLTDSLWSQILATAIRGDRTGDTLELLPSSLTTWRAWREEYPDTVVLLPPPASSTVNGRDVRRDYGRNPYAGYEESRRIGIGGSYDDDRLHPKAIVIGIEGDGVSRAYPLEAVAAAGVVNDTVGGRPVVVTVARDDTLVAYERTVDGEPLEFAAGNARTMTASGSRWNRATGRAIDGPHEGTTLAPATEKSPMFFFAWLDFTPDTEVYGT